MIFLKLSFLFIFRMYVSYCLLLLLLANVLFQFQVLCQAKRKLCSKHQYLLCASLKQYQILRICHILRSSTNFFPRFLDFPLLLRTIYYHCCCWRLVASSCLTLLQTRGLQPTRLLCPWDSPGKNTGMGCCVLLQGIFPTQASNPCLLHLTCMGRRVLYSNATWEAQNNAGVHQILSNE